MLKEKRILSNYIELCQLTILLQTWNMTVQYWLAVNVYRRLPGLSRGLRSLVVMVVSSAWHGVYPGM